VRIKQKVIALAALLLAIGVVALISIRGSASKSHLTSPVLSTPSGPASKKSGPSVVLTINPNDRGDARQTQRRDTRSEIAREFSDALSLKKFFEKYSAPPFSENSEALFFLARILHRCGSSVSPTAPSAQARNEENKRRFLAQLSATDALYKERVLAYDEVSLDRCAGLEDLKSSEQQIKELLQKSARLGDPKSAALLVQRDLWDRMDEQQRTGANATNSLPAPTDDQIKVLLAAMKSTDPIAIAIVGPILSSSLQDVSVRFGTNSDQIDNQAFHQAYRLLACDFGAPCDRSNESVLRACAFDRQCSVATLEDWLLYYQSSPYRSQLSQTYRSQLNDMIARGDLSGLQFVRGPVPTNGSRQVFRGY
jgi:hypothetical protein